MTARTLAYVRSCALLDLLAVPVGGAGAAGAFFVWYDRGVGTRPYVIYGLMAACGTLAMLLGTVLVRRGIGEPGRIRAATTEGLVAVTLGALVVGGPPAWVAAMGAFAWLRGQPPVPSLMLPPLGWLWVGLVATLCLLAAANLGALIALRRS